MTRRILVVRPGALGDAILTLPALHALRSRYPAAHLQVIGYRSIWEVGRPLLDEVVPIDASRFTGLFDGSLTPALRDWLRGVDLAVAWTATDISDALRDSGIRDLVRQTPYPPADTHAADWLYASVAPTGQQAPLPSIRLTDEEVAQGAMLSEALGVAHPVVIHPGAGATWKRWPAGSFADLARKLWEKGHQVLLVEGPADHAATVELQARVSRSIPVVRETSLRRLAAVLARSVLFVGNDSGVTHLAAACGVPTLALFGPTDPTCWAPRGKVEVLRACSTHATRSMQIRVCGDPTCMAGIAVREVLARVDRLLAC